MLGAGFDILAILIPGFTFLPLAEPYGPRFKSKRGYRLRQNTSTASLLGGSVVE